MNLVTTDSKTRSESYVLEQLEHHSCEFCSDGSLVRATFKGNDAVVCDCCGTPAVQFWKKSDTVDC